jgi:biopolymer transport protein ExbB
MSSKISKVSAALAFVAASFFGLHAAVTAQTSPAASPAAPAATAPAPVAPAAAPAAAATPAKPAAGATSVQVENPYGIKALWQQSYYVAKGTLVILVIMSIGSWYIIFAKLAEQSKMNRQAAEASRDFWSAGTVRQGADSLKKDSPYRFIAESGLEATKKHDGLLGQIDLSTWITMGISRAIDNVQSRTQDGLAFLATVGSTAPFVGLFGTVWGILNALISIGVSGQASIDKVAGPVGESLYMTAFGLVVAVPAVLGYNWLVRRNKAAMDKVRAFGSDLHSVLLAASTRK